MRIRLSSLLVVAALPLLPVTAARAQETGVSVTYAKNIKKAVDTIEKIERFIDGQGEFDWLKIPDAISAARTNAEAYLESRPDDLGALMLLVRVGRLEALFAPTMLTTEDGEWVGDTTNHLAPVHATLDRVLELEPRLAEAYYVKARLLATANPRFDGDSLIIDVDWPGCLTNAERAVALAPRERPYRELLALARAESGDLDGAADAVRDIDKGKNLVYLLLTDFASVPMPDDVIALPRIQSTFAEMAGQAGLGGYANLRVKAFAVAGGAEGIETFYRETWPDFTLFLQEESEMSRTFGQLLNPAKDGFSPTESPDALERNQDPDKGIMMMVTEMDGLTDAALAYPDDPRLQGKFTQVIMINYRKK